MFPVCSWAEIQKLCNSTANLTKYNICASQHDSAAPTRTRQCTLPQAIPFFKTHPTNLLSKFSLPCRFIP